ncbi:hypothetical protein EJ08DRAFT_734028 [Tothia fuscella]|uniref:Uncharacterized protein n=1 Tax=Tothia fuscella TaxID=1048955 RepID=A0A9P4NS98_9PEZI|nr:hypothetical protein EJ08DRAFT_734028 [Tothia fuscella]
MTRAYRKRSLSHIVYDSLLPDEAEIIDEDPDANLPYHAYEAKRRRIEEIARNYIGGSAPYISSSTLKGPFPSGWKNPYRRRPLKPGVSAKDDREGEAPIRVIEGDTFSTESERNITKEEFIPPAWTASIPPVDREGNVRRAPHGEFGFPPEVKPLFTVYLDTGTGKLHSYTHTVKWRSLNSGTALVSELLAAHVDLHHPLGGPPSDGDDQKGLRDKLAQARPHRKRSLSPLDLPTLTSKDETIFTTRKVLPGSKKDLPSHRSSDHTLEWLRQQRSLKVTPEPEDSIISSIESLHATPSKLSKPYKLVATKTSRSRTSSPLQVKTDVMEETEVFEEGNSCSTERTSLPPNPLPESLQANVSSSVSVTALLNAERPPRRQRKQSPCVLPVQNTAGTMQHGRDIEPARHHSGSTPINLTRPVNPRVTDIARGGVRHPLVASPTMASDSPGFVYRRASDKQELSIMVHPRVNNEHNVEPESENLHDDAPLGGDDFGIPGSRDRSSSPDSELQLEREAAPLEPTPLEPTPLPLPESEADSSFIEQSVRKTTKRAAPPNPAPTVTILIKADASGNWSCPVPECVSQDQKRQESSLRSHVKRVHNGWGCTVVPSKANRIFPPTSKRPSLKVTAAAAVIDDSISEHDGVFPGPSHSNNLSDAPLTPPIAAEPAEHNSAVPRLLAINQQHPILEQLPVQAITGDIDGNTVRDLDTAGDQLKSVDARPDMITSAAGLIEASELGNIDTGRPQSNEMERSATVAPAQTHDSPRIPVVQKGSPLGSPLTRPPVIPPVQTGTIDLQHVETVHEEAEVVGDDVTQFELAPEAANVPDLEEIPDTSTLRAFTRLSNAQSTQTALNNAHRAFLDTQSSELTPARFNNENIPPLDATYIRKIGAFTRFGEINPQETQQRTPGPTFDNIASTQNLFEEAAHIDWSTVKKPRAAKKASFDNWAIQKPSQLHSLMSQKGPSRSILKQSQAVNVTTPSGLPNLQLRSTSFSARFGGSQDTPSSVVKETPTRPSSSLPPPRNWNNELETQASYTYGASLTPIASVESPRLSFPSFSSPAMSPDAPSSVPVASYEAAPMVKSSAPFPTGRTDSFQAAQIASTAVGTTNETQSTEFDSQDISDVLDMADSILAEGNVDNDIREQKRLGVGSSWRAVNVDD